MAALGRAAVPMLLVAAAAGCKPLPVDGIDPPRRGLSGAVVDQCAALALAAAPGEPAPGSTEGLAGVLVEVDGASTLTGERGTFALPEVAVGTHVVTLSRAGYEPAGPLVHVTDAGTVAILPLVPRRAPVATPAVDVLFVVDDSGSMAEEQAGLAGSMARFVAELEAVGADFRLGVTTTDLGAGGFAVDGCAPDAAGGARLRADGACGVAPERPWVESGDPAAAAAIACLTTVGTGGCGFEQPLEAMRATLEARDPADAGFLRSGAALLVVLFTDEDDCSAGDDALFDPADVAVAGPLGPLSSYRCFDFGVACAETLPDHAEDRSLTGPRTACAPDEASRLVQPVQRYLDFLTGVGDGALVRGGRPLLLVTVAGAPEPVVVGRTAQGEPRLEPACGSPAGSATPAVRLFAAARRLGVRARSASICAGDLADTLGSIAREAALAALAAGVCAP